MLIDLSPIYTRLELPNFNKHQSAKTFLGLALSGTLPIYNTKQWEIALANMFLWARQAPIVDEGKEICAGRVICSIYTKLTGHSYGDPEKVQKSYLDGKPFPFTITKKSPVIHLDQVPSSLRNFKKGPLMLFIGKGLCGPAHVIEIGEDYIHDPSRKRIECDSPEDLKIRLAAYLLTAYSDYTEARIYACSTS